MGFAAVPSGALRSACWRALTGSEASDREFPLDVGRIDGRSFAPHTTPSRDAGTTEDGHGRADPGGRADVTGHGRKSD